MAGINIKSLSTDISKQNAGRSIWTRDLSIGNKKPSIAFKERFFLELATLLEAGMDLKAVLELLEQEYKNEKETQTVKQVKGKVVAGASFSEALQKVGSFSAYEYYSVKIGEETGQLVKVAYEIASYYSRKRKQRKQIISALSYPMVIMLTSFLAVGFMLGFIVPMFTDVFKRFNGELPYITQLIINLSGFITDHLYSGMAFLLVAIAALYFISSFQAVQRSFSMAILKIPVLGSFIKTVYLARFNTSLALLVASKVPLLEALKLVGLMVNFYPIERAIKQMEGDILQGESFHLSLGKHAIFSNQMVAMIKVGEEVNKLDVFLERMAMRCEEDIDQRTQLLTTFLEPFMIIVLGIMVGVILVAMYLPMFELSTSIM